MPEVLGLVVARQLFDALVLVDELSDDAIDLSLRAALADELLDQDQVLLTHTSKVQPEVMSTGNRSGNQVVNG
jgi:hypothetical protein